MTTPTRLHPSEYRQVIWDWVKKYPAHSTPTIANSIGLSQSTVAHVLTDMANDAQLKRKKVQVDSDEAGKKPVSIYHYWALGTVFKPVIKEPPPLAPVPSSPNTLSVREALLLKINAAKVTTDPLELVKHLDAADLIALRDALNNLTA